jgi:hypothetical protein
MKTITILALTIAAFAGRAFALTTNSVGLVQYQSFNGNAYLLKPWFGSNVCILASTTNQFDSNVLSKIVIALDKAYSFYAAATGQQPVSYDPTTLYGKDTIAEVTNTCGAGCSYLGYTGTEILIPYFNLLYSGVASSNVYDQVLFYEFGRNFWFYGDQLAYHSPDSDPVTTGFAVYMRFLAMDAAGVTGGPFNGYSFQTFRSTVTNMIDLYITNSALNWSNTFRINQAPSNPLGLGATDLTASLLMRIGRDFGGPDFGLNIWKQAALRPTATTTQAAVDNFILAACATVNENLTQIFSSSWKFPVSAAAIQEAQQRWGNPVVFKENFTDSLEVSNNWGNYGSLFQVAAGQGSLYPTAQTPVVPVGPNEKATLHDRGNQPIMFGPDFTYEADVQMTGALRTWLMFGNDSNGRIYEVGFDIGSAFVALSSLLDADFASPGTFQLLDDYRPGGGSYHRWRLQVAGGTNMDFYIDAHHVLTGTLNGFIPGPIGMRSWDAGGSSFENISASNLLPPYAASNTLTIVTTNGGFGFANNQFHFTLTGPAGSNVVIYASTNLQAWVSLITNSLGGGSITFTDMLATIFPTRFYRATLLP